MGPDVLFFFEKDPAMLPVYEALETKILAAVENTSIRVQKTQITFTNPKVYAAVSFLPARKKAMRPAHYITLTLGLNRKLASPRVDAASEPYPSRWTHHLMISSINEIDGELMAWICEAAAFSAAKR